jgi:hypothetical protein
MTGAGCYIFLADAACYSLFCFYYLILTSFYFNFSSYFFNSLLWSSSIFFADLSSLYSGVDSLFLLMIWSFLITILSDYPMLSVIFFYFLALFPLDSSFLSLAFITNFLDGFFYSFAGCYFWTGGSSGSGLIGFS